jgi:hypothetical protein
MSESEIKAVEIHAELRQIRTMADGSANVILNVPEYCREQVKVMLDWLHELVTAVVVWEPKQEETLTELDDETTKGAEGSGPKVDRRRTTNRRDK